MTGTLNGPLMHSSRATLRQRRGVTRSTALIHFYHISLRGSKPFYTRTPAKVEQEPFHSSSWMGRFSFQNLSSCRDMPGSGEISNHHRLLKQHIRTPGWNLRVIGWSKHMAGPWGAFLSSLKRRAFPSLSQPTLPVPRASAVVVSLRRGVQHHRLEAVTRVLIRNGQDKGWRMRSFGTRYDDLTLLYESWACLKIVGHAAARQRTEIPLGRFYALMEFIDHLPPSSLVPCLPHRACEHHRALSTA